jgi:hypothetical protein
VLKQINLPQDYVKQGQSALRELKTETILNKISKLKPNGLNKSRINF